MKQKNILLFLFLIISMQSLFANVTKTVTHNGNKTNIKVLAKIGQGNNYICPKQLSLTVFKKTNMLYICPPMKNHQTILTKADNGMYECDYINSKTYNTDVKCFYKSPFIQDNLKKVKHLLNYNYAVSINKILYPPYDIENTYIPDTLLLSGNFPEDIQDIYAKLSDISSGEEQKIYHLTPTYKQIKDMFSAINNNLMGNIKSNMRYYNRNYTFSSFLGKIITLDPNLIQGVNKINLSLILNPEWINKTLSVNYDPNHNHNWIHSVLHALGYVFSFKWLYTSNKVKTPVYNSNYYASSFGAFFKAPIWGYYYLLMSNMDYLINKIAILLMISIGAYIGGMGLTKSFIQAKLNSQQEFGGQSQANKYTKLIGAMGLVTFFLLSPTTKSKNGTTEFYTNDTIAKSMIRQMVDMGNLFGTLTNDAGLDAYLHYFVNRNGVVNIKAIKQDMDLNVINLMHIKYQTAIMYACMKKYNKNSIHDFFIKEGNKNVIPPVNYNPMLPYVYTNNISYSLCQNIAKNIIYNSRQILSSIKHDYSVINVLSGFGDGSSNAKMKAVKYSVATMLLLNRKFGWVSAMIVPSIDNIMKATDMFLVINNLKSNGNTVKNFIKANSVNKKGQNTGVGINESPIEEGMSKILGAMSIYSVLPGFSPMFKNIYKFTEAGLNAVPFLGLSEKLILKGGIKLVAASTAFYLAIKLWNLSLQIILSVLIALIILFKIVFYFKDVLMYFVLSVFVPLLGFSRDMNQKINKILLDGLYLTLYPIILVFLIYLFVFAEQLFQFIFDTIFKAFSYSQLNVIRAMVNAHSVLSFSKNFEAFLFAKSISTAGNALSVIFSLIIAYFILFKGSSWILEKLGLNNLASSEKHNEQFIERGIKNVNPIV